MKSIVAVLMIVVFLCPEANAQKKRKKPASNSRASSSQPSPVTKPRIIGSTVTIITKNDDRLVGGVLDLTAYSVRIRSNNLESTIALDTVASMSFGDAAAPGGKADQSSGPVRPDFARDANAALGFFQSLAVSLKPGVDYVEYGRQLSELKRAAERLITRYSTTDNAAEARVCSLMAGALTDYTWARTIWSLKFGRSSDGTIGETDSPVVIDAVALYPDIHGAAMVGNRLSAEKLIGGLWRKASEKTDRARALIAQSH